MLLSCINGNVWCIVCIVLFCIVLKCIVLKHLLILNFLLVWDLQVFLFYGTPLNSPMWVVGLQLSQSLSIIINVLSVSPGKAYPPEFYYDTYNPLWQNRPRVYGFKLQWTQMNPNAVDRIVAYRLGIRQVGWLRAVCLRSHSVFTVLTHRLMA